MQEHDFETMRHCAYAYLRHIRAAIGEIDEIEGQMAKQQASLALMGISYDTSGGGCSADRIPDGVAKAFELRERWSEAYARLAGDIEHARELCSSEHKSRRMLWLHVVEGRTWQQVSAAMGYSTRHAIRMAENGAVALYYAMPEEWRRYSIPNAMPQ
ncbi:MAG: hypothetical protein U0M51_02055 [Eggerthellaceae bacterium]